MQRATPVQMRKSLELVELFMQTGLRFVPMPIFDENDFNHCIAEMSKKLNEIERRANVAETSSNPPQSPTA